MNQKLCLILRGLPGCGKSYYLQEAFGNFAVCSADHFFTKPDGTYAFDVGKLQEAHEACFRRFVSLTAYPDSQDSCCKYVAVDNTNVDVSEIAPYYLCASAFGYTVLVLNVLCDPLTAHRRNKHGVTLDTIVGMQNRFSALPPRMRQLTVVQDEPSVIRDRVMERFEACIPPLA